MIRRLFSFAVLISLLAALLCGAAWARSHWIMDSFALRGHTTLSQRWNNQDLTSVVSTIWELDSREGQLHFLRAAPTWGNQMKIRGMWRQSTVFHVAWKLPNPGADTDWQPIQTHLVASRVQFGGFGWIAGAGPGYEYAPIRMAIVPWWFLTGLCCLLPVLWCWKWATKPRYGKGLCQTCGYDLRATPGQCPECGTPVEIQSAGPQEAL